ESAKCSPCERSRGWNMPSSSRTARTPSATGLPGATIGWRGRSSPALGFERDPSLRRSRPRKRSCRVVGQPTPVASERDATALDRAHPVESAGRPGDILHASWPAEEEPLAELDAEATTRPPIGVCLDALGDEHKP